MKARIRRISASVDTAISFGSTSSSDAGINTEDLNSSTEIPHGYNPSSKSLDICVPESRIERMRKLLSSPLLRRRNASQHGPFCFGHHHHHKHTLFSSSSSSSPSSSPALGSSNNSSMKTFGVSLESLSHHQHPHHHKQHQHQNYPEEYYVRDHEQVVVPHQKAAHILGQVCPGCLTSAPSNSSSTGSINDTSSGHFSHHASSHLDDFFTSSMSSSVAASPSSGTSSSSTTSSTSSVGGHGSVPCLIPYIVTRLCNYIENSGGMVQEGLFRISGNAKLVEKLKHSFDVTGDAPLETEGDLASAAALLKQFLRELPQPLIPNGHQFLDVIRSLKNEHETCILSLKALVSQLPDENYYTLRYLLRFLHRIAQRNEENRMTSSNLGIVFAPNIFRVCMDTYQGLKDQSSANEVINLLITEFGEIFNETSEVGSTSVGETGSSREDLSSAISCDSETSCPFTCSLNVDCSTGDLQQQPFNYENLVVTIEQAKQDAERLCANIPALNITLSPDKDVSNDTKTNTEAITQLNRRRKDYQNKNHRTIDEFFEDERCQSFDYGQTHSSHTYASKQVPIRCNSDGNNEELVSSINEPISVSSNIDDTYRKQVSYSQPHEIIITNSSDSVSTDDNTTTTATSTGATVCSVVIGIGQLAINNQDSDQNLSSEENLDRNLSSRLLACEHVSTEAIFKTGRSGSCGSDCTENINIPASLSFTSDEEEDSLSKSIASECSDGSSSTSSRPSSACSGSCSGNEAGSSSCNDNGNDDKNSIEQANVLVQVNDESPQNDSISEHLVQNKPWRRNDTLCLDSGPPLLSQQCSEMSLNESEKHSLPNSINTSKDASPEAPKSPSAYRHYLNNQETHLNQTYLPPLQPIDKELSIYVTDEQQTENSEVNTKNSDSLTKTTKIPGLRSRNRRLQSIRRKLRQFESDFQQENGYRATYEHKMASSFARPLMIELSSLLNLGSRNLKDLDNYNFDNEFIIGEEDFLCNKYLNGECRTVSEDTLTSSSHITNKSKNSWKYNSEMVPVFTTDDIFNTIFGNSKDKSLSKISEMMNEIQRTLREKRSMMQRPESLDSMTSEQIFDEKLALQKALLRFEALYGRPNSKAERDIVRPVYDRYRLVKRYAARIIQKLGNKEVNNELQPIIEHVQMNFTSPTHQQKPPSESVSSKSQDDKSVPKKAENKSDISTSVDDSQTCKSMCDTALLTPNTSDTNFHEMSREDLLANLRELKQQKRNLRSVLRTFENDFYKKTGRRVEKEDRCNMSTVYYSYKNTKGKIRLLEALVTKYESRKCAN